MTKKAKSPDELYEKLEQELRTPAERLLLDAFLPSPEAIPSALYRPAPPAPEPDPAAAGLFAAQQAAARERNAEEEPAPRRKPRPKKTAEPQRSLEEEVQDFLNLRGTALAPDTDPDSQK